MPNCIFKSKFLQFSADDVRCLGMQLSGVAVGGEKVVKAAKAKVGQGWNGVPIEFAIEDPREGGG